MKIPQWLSTTLSFILIGLLLVAYFATHTPPKKNAPATIMQAELGPVTFDHILTIAGTELHVAYANMPAEQERGLSGTQSLGEDQGMLFLFPTENTPSFWMKDMNYPIDMIWVASNKKVVDITPSVDPSTYPKTFSPKSPAQYVLEMPAGFAEKNTIEEGTQVSF